MAGKDKQKQLGSEQEEIRERVNLHLLPEHSEKLALIRRKLGLDNTNTLRYLISTYELKSEREERLLRLRRLKSKS